MRFNIHLMFFLLVTITSCSNIDGELELDLYGLAESIKSKEIHDIEKITTKKGLTSILAWSDSLRNEQFINLLVDNLQNARVFDTHMTDSVIYLSLGKSDEIVGATGGYLSLKEVNGELKIHSFRGGR